MPAAQAQAGALPRGLLFWSAQDRPHSLGEQPLHELSCELIVDGRVHDHRSCRTAFRTVRLRDWTLHVNGVRLFTKGVVMLPTTPRPGDAIPLQVAADVRAARDAGLDLIRLVAHVRKFPSPDPPSHSIPSETHPTTGSMSLFKLRSSPVPCLAKILRLDFAPDTIRFQAFSESRPRSSHPVPLIGRKVSKEFRDDGSGLLDRFTGTVTHFHPNLGVGWFTVLYEDGDT